MDENIDLYLSSSPWSDMNPEERSSWECGENETKGQMANSFGVFGMDENDLYTERTSSLTVNCLPTQDALGGSIDYLISSDIFSGETELRKGVDSFNDNCPNIPQNSWLKDESMAKYDMNLPRIGSYSYNASQGLRLDAPEELLETCNGTSLSFAKIGRDGCNDIENFNTPFEEILPPICGAYSPSNAVERNRMQAFGAGRGDFDNDVGSRSVEMNKPLPPDNFSALITTKEGQISQSKGFPSLATESLKAEKASGLPQPVLETIYTPTTGCNVSGKPRLRARRGQATDPHSIAERLRREKISERMKSLQELVPSSSKTDKASMLDEIIEYVRFLQLQVKVLSMSRLGAAEAVVPLVKHNHAEFQGSKSGLILSSSSFEELEYSPSPDQIAFEREIVKLMETNVSEAVQCLQRKGLCLMPIALASAISKTKAQVTDDKSGCLVQNSSSSSSNSNNSSFS